MRTFLRQPWHIAGFARQGCRTNWLFGIDGGNQKERHFNSFFSCSDERIRDLCFSIEMVLFLHKSCDVCCLLCSFLFLNKKCLHFSLRKTVQNRFRHVWIDFGEGSFCAYFPVKCIFLTSLSKLVVSPDFNPQSLFGDYFLDQYPNSNFF